jgi:hypothetical protein
MTDPLELECMVLFSPGYCEERGIANPPYVVELQMAGGSVQRVAVLTGALLDTLIEELAPPEIVFHLPRGVIGTMVRGPNGVYFDEGETAESQIAALRRGTAVH